jgi:hypothetical protein
MFRLQRPTSAADFRYEPVVIYGVMILSVPLIYLAIQHEGVQGSFNSVSGLAVLEFVFSLDFWTVHI